MKLKSKFRFGVLLPAIFVCTHLVQAEYLLEPEFQHRFLVNDNRQLRLDDETTVVGSLTSIGTRLTRSAETSKLVIDPRFRFVRYTKEETFASEDASLLLESEKYGERYFWGASISLRKDPTLTSELTDSGRLATNKNRYEASISTNYSYSVYEQLRVFLNGAMSDVRYQDGLTVGLVDYEYYSIGGGVTYALSELSRFTASLSATKFHNPSISSSTRSGSVVFTLEHDFSSFVSGSIGIGQNRSQIESVQSRAILLPGPRVGIENFRNESRDAGELINVSLNVDYPRLDVELDFSRQFLPSSRGARSNRDEVNANFYYDVRPRLRFRLRGKYLIQVSEGGLVSDLDREYNSATGSLTWRLSKYWALDGMYTFRRQLFSSSSRAANSNEVSLTLRFGGYPFSLN